MYIKYPVLIVIGALFGKLADVLKREIKNISGMLTLAVAV